MRLLRSCGIPGSAVAFASTCIEVFAIAPPDIVLQRRCVATARSLDQCRYVAHCCLFAHRFKASTEYR